MMPVASLPVETVCVTRLWIVGVVTLTSLPPLLIWAVRHHWQLTIRSLLVMTAILALALSWVRAEVATYLRLEPPVVARTDPTTGETHWYRIRNYRYVPKLWWTTGPSPGEIAFLLFFLSVVLSCAWWSTNRHASTQATNTGQSQDRPGADQPGG